MNVQQINSTIISGQLSNSDLESIVSAIKFARSQLTRQKAGTLVIGTHVKFTSSRGGGTVYVVWRAAQSQVCGAPSDQR